MFSTVEGGSPLSKLLMRYILLEKSSLPKTDPIHANPLAGDWVVYDQTDGYIATTFFSRPTAVLTVEEWNEEDEDETEG